MVNKLKPKSEFSKNVLTLMTGTTIAQAIPIAISPILTRLYTPEDFGVFALFVAITSIFATIVNGRYELAIMLPKKDEDAINIVALGVIICSCISLLLLIIAVIFNNQITTLLGNSEISFWLYFVPIVVFLSGMWNVLNYFNNRKKNYKDLKNATIIRAIIVAIIQLSIGFVKQGAIGLISGQIVSQFFANTKLAKNIIKDKILVAKISKPKIIALAKRYKDFPIHSLPASFVDNLTLQMNLLLIPKIFSFSISGYFFLAQKIVNMPASLIANSVSQVYFQKLSENKNNQKESFTFFISTVKKLFFIAFPITIVVYICSPFLFSFIFGEEWKMSGEIAQYLAIIFFIRFIVSPLSISFSVTNELYKSAFWKYLYFTSTSILFCFVMILKINLENFLLFLVLHEVILYSIYFIFIINTIRKLDKIIMIKREKLCAE